MMARCRGGVVAWNVAPTDPDTLAREGERCPSCPCIDQGADVCCFCGGGHE